jgi:alpha-amylase/alpha-mannosidase (GH57 family)
LPILFLWHHHQPFYQAPDAAYPLMPWVRLHAVRGYLDMLTAVKETGARVTFNMTPSLIEQLQFAGQAEISDEFERVSQIEAHHLNEDERKFLLTHFFSINWNVHVLTHPRYKTLLAKRGERMDKDSLRQALIDYAAQDYADLVALFNLTWIGFAGRRVPAIAALIKKQKGYSQGDIAEILAYHKQVVRGTLPAYGELYSADQIEISVSPYAHPILPLLCDSRVASPDIPRQQLPKLDYCHPEDAARQLKAACQLHEAVWGRMPSGLWPSEGSVSDEVLNLASKQGFRWLATDQGILDRSERSRTDPLAHFVSHGWKLGEQAIRLYFRDRALSDAIGFRYSAMSPEDGINEFVGHLERIEEGTRAIHGRCTAIALDGENPWESYPDGGEAFLTGLFTKLTKHPKLTTARFSDHMQVAAREKIQHIHPGSWIDSNFHIWIGDPQKNDAWTELGRARRMVDDLNAGDPRRDACWKWLLRAQGSDWFWWYGEPFNSPYEWHFDELFRSYVRAAYEAADRIPPPSLDVPICIPLRTERRLQPAYPISPVIDGKDTSFFEWAGACRIDPRQYGAVMGRSEHSIRALYYGFSEQELFFRFDPANMLRPRQTMAMTFSVQGETQLSVRIPLDDQIETKEDDGVRWARDRIIEVAVSQQRVGVVPGGECQFWLEIEDDHIILEKLPPAGVFRYVVPTKEMVAANWKI